MSEDPIEYARSTQQLLIVVSIVALVALPGHLREEFKLALDEAALLQGALNDFSPESLAQRATGAPSPNALQTDSTIRSLLNAARNRTDRCRISLKYNASYIEKLLDMHTNTFQGKTSTPLDVEGFMNSTGDNPIYDGFTTFVLTLDRLHELNMDRACSTAIDKNTWLELNVAGWRVSGTIVMQVEIDGLDPIQIADEVFVPRASLRSVATTLLDENRDPDGKINYTFIASIRRLLPETAVMELVRIPAYVAEESERAAIVVDVLGVQIKKQDFMLCLPFILLFLIGNHMHTLDHALTQTSATPEGRQRQGRWYFLGTSANAVAMSTLSVTLPLVAAAWATIKTQQQFQLQMGFTTTSMATLGLHVLCLVAMLVITKKIWVMRASAKNGTS